MSLRPLFLGLVTLATTLLLCACEPERGARDEERAPRTGYTGTPSTGQTAENIREGTVDRAPDVPTTYGFTYGSASGNRVERAMGGLSDADPVKIQLHGGPAWVVGVPIEDDTAWIVAYGNGEIETFRLDGKTDEVTPSLTAPDVLPAGAPPAVRVEGERLTLLTEERGTPSTFTHPAPFEGDLIGITMNGTLVPGRGVRALPDARPVVSDDGRLAILADPTTAYEHGVLGDALEAESIAILDGEKTTRVEPESGGVFEALAPIWFRPAPGRGELLAVTESIEALGTRISVYDPEGELVAAGPYVGEPETWRHLIAAAPFGPEGQTEIAATRTPHLDPRTELYCLEGDDLQLVAEGPGYPTHTIYSRNLDAARAADTDGDGVYELVVPDPTYTALVVLRRTGSGMEPARKLPLGFTLATNIASTTDESGHLYIAAGTMDGILTIFR